MKTEVRLLDAAELAADPGRWSEFVAEASVIMAELVRGGAAIGWVEPPGEGEVRELLDRVLASARDGDASLRAAYLGPSLAGLGHWQRYPRPTHRTNADLQKIAVAPDRQGRGIGRALTAALVEDARTAGIEVLTLDARGDNEAALGLYASLGFVEYGRLPGFVNFGGRRYDRVCCLIDLRTAPRSDRAPAGSAGGSA
jgi:ribosomal protein S18 acetylase RimI-like enzyme